MSENLNPEMRGPVESSDTIAVPEGGEGGRMFSSA